MKKIFLGLVLLGTLATVNAATTAWLLPNANGTFSTWTSSSTLPKYTLVDETSCNGNVDYVSTYTLNARESYSVPLTSIPDGSTITAVYVAPCALQDTETSSTSSLSMFSVVNGVSSSYVGTYLLKGTSTPSSYSYAYIRNTPVIKNASTKIEAGVVLVSGPIGGARLSRIAAVVVYNIPVPTAPTNLVATKNATNTSVTLAWNDTSNNETYFMVERSTNGVTFSLMARIGANNTKYTIASEVTGTSYYRVRAYNSGGYSTYTNIASVTIVPVITIPSAPTNANVSAASSTNVIYWNDNSSNETGFAYERSVDYGVTFMPYGTTTNPYFVETETMPGLYYYRIRAFNSAGLSAYSNIAVLNIEAQIPAPSAVTASLYDSNTVSINWMDNSIDETGFMIERSANGTSTWIQIATTTFASVTYFADTGLTVGTYYYRVRAYNGLGLSAYSLPSAPVSVVPPVAPSAVFASITDPNTPYRYITVTWTDNSQDELGFLIDRSNDGSTWFHLATTTYPNLPLFNDASAVLISGNHYYRLRAYNALGNSAYSLPSYPLFLSTGSTTMP